jgi:hypothetical protein
MRSESPGIARVKPLRSACTHRTLGGAALFATMLVFHSCAHSDGGPQQSSPAPLLALEAHSDYGMVSTGSVEATRAGVQMLERGGNAVDAAVAAAFALGVADPGGSGLGGMTYILISPANGPAVAVDGSATVPLSADASALLELRNSGEHMGAKAVAVPATLAALNHALERYGTMTLEEVLQPSIEIADRGYRLSLNTVAWTTGYFKEILASPYLRYVVLDGGERAGSVGDVMCRPDLAATLRRIAGPAGATSSRSTSHPFGHKSSGRCGRSIGTRRSFPTPGREGAARWPRRSTSSRPSHATFFARTRSIVFT